MVGESIRKCSRSRRNCSCASLSSTINLLAVLRQQVVVTRLIIYKGQRVVWQPVTGLRLFPALEHLLSPLGLNFLGLFSPFHVKVNVVIVYQFSIWSVPLHWISTWSISNVPWSGMLVFEKVHATRYRTPAFFRMLISAVRHFWLRQLTKWGWAHEWGEASRAQPGPDLQEAPTNWPARCSARAYSSGWWLVWQPAIGEPGANFLGIKGSFVQRCHKRWRAESYRLPPLPAALPG